MARPERTTKQVVDDTRAHLSELVDAHVALARAEMKETQQQIAATVAPFAIAGVLGLFILAFFGVTAAKALEIVVEPWLAWLIVSLALTFIAVVLGLVGRSKAKQINASPERTKRELTETVEWARTRVSKVGD